MIKPTMFSKPKIPCYIAYAIVDDLGNVYTNNLSPACYLMQKSAEYMLELFRLQKTHRVAEVNYNPNTDKVDE